jgi:hypothetical protein
MGGSLLQLAAKGSQDAVLSYEPQITFFKSIHKKHTNFSIETIEQIFSNNVDFNSIIQCTISKNADLISNIYLYLELPKLPQEYEMCGTTKKKIVSRNWINSIGHSIIEHADITIGGLLIDRQYGEWLEIWGELTQQEEKRAGYFEMIGKITDGLNTLDIDKFEGPMKIYVPLNFWFCRNIGLALPLVALQYHDVEISIKLRSFHECYITSNGIELNSNLNLNGHLLVDYIYLDSDERKRFSKNTHEYLIEQLQVNHEFINASQKNFSIPLNFNHPVKELVWIIKREDIGKYNNDDEDDIIYGNDWFNFSSTVGSYHGFDDTFETGKILFNNSDRIATKNAEYFRLIQPYVYHSRIPSKQIYVYSFSIRPEEHQPTGTCNFSRIDNSNLVLSKKDNTHIGHNVSIYAINYNILKIEGGMGGIMFSN